MDIYFKIIEAQDGTQVCFEKGFDPNTESDALIASFYIDGVKITQQITFKLDGVLQEKFDELNRSLATSIVNDVKRHLLR